MVAEDVETDLPAKTAEAHFSAEIASSNKQTSVVDETDNNAPTMPELVGIMQAEPEPAVASNPLDSTLLDSTDSTTAQADHSNIASENLTDQSSDHIQDNNNNYSSQHSYHDSKTINDQGPQDHGLQDQGPQDQGPHDQGLQDQGLQDQGPQRQDQFFIKINTLNYANETNTSRLDVAAGESSPHEDSIGQQDHVEPVKSAGFSQKVQSPVHNNGAKLPLKASESRRHTQTQANIYICIYSAISIIPNFRRIQSSPSRFTFYSLLLRFHSLILSPRSSLWG